MTAADIVRRGRVRRCAALGFAGALLALGPLGSAPPVHAKTTARLHERAGLRFARVPGGRFEPPYPVDPAVREVEVAAFLLMVRPVTNGEFAEFVQQRPEYRRDRIARVFADEGYLAHWATADGPEPSARAAQPVTRVSWFAAKAFCESRGLRLPTEAEWELAAAASETRRDARQDPRFRERLLRWYATPSRELPDVPHGAANVYGLRDLHGVVWEWVLDFNNAVVLADSRNQGDAVREQFCGGGALLARENADYAAFMRTAVRGSLQASYTIGNLGFRCAADLEPAGGAP